MAGIYLALVAATGFLQGAIVDKHRKKTCMLMSSLASLSMYVLAFSVHFARPSQAFNDPANPALWLVIGASLLAAIAGNIRTIALMTCVTLLIPEASRDRANGLVGSVTGIAFLGASAISGAVIGYAGMHVVLIGAIAVTLIAIAHICFVRIPEHLPQHNARTANTDAAEDSNKHKIDLSGTLAIVKSIPGLLGLIIFSAFNNLLGGVFMSLMDAYGLSLVSVSAWGFIWAFLSGGMIVGGLIVSKTGLGRNPVRTLMLANCVSWFACCIFTLRSDIFLLSFGCLVFMVLMPCIESAEQTVMQKVIPFERQGRVFGFAQSVEQSASPLTAFFIGPIAQFVFIPFMTTGEGVRLLGPWFGVGAERGLALVFTTAGILGLLASALAMRTRQYHDLSTYYQKEPVAEF